MRDRAEPGKRKPGTVFQRAQFVHEQPGIVIELAWQRRPVSRGHDVMIVGLRRHLVHMPSFAG